MSLRFTLLLGLVLWAALAGSLSAAAPVGLAAPRVLLEFDLSNDRKPTANLRVNGAAPGPSDVNVALPFPLREPPRNTAALVRHGSYETWSLISFNQVGVGWPQDIRFTPVFEHSATIFENGGETDSDVFLLVSGQERRFRYRYPRDDRFFRNAGPGTRLALTPVDAISIKLPPEAREFSVKPGRLSSPDRISAEERIFPGRAPNSEEDVLMVNYQVPVTDAQKLVVDWGLKILALSIPLLGLAFTPRSAVANRKLQIILFVLGGVVSVAVVVWVMWFSPSSGRFDFAFNAALVFVSAVIGALILRVKP